jgi:hypothetical protein
MKFRKLSPFSIFERVQKPRAECVIHLTDFSRGDRVRYFGTWISQYHWEWIYSATSWRVCHVSTTAQRVKTTTRSPCLKSLEYQQRVTLSVFIVWHSLSTLLGFPGWQGAIPRGQVSLLMLSTELVDPPHCPMSLGLTGNEKPSLIFTRKRHFRCKIPIDCLAKVDSVTFDN